MVINLSLSIENYTNPHVYAQYEIIQSLAGIYHNQIEIIDLIHHTGARRGDIAITLTSPHGTVSHLLPARERDFVNAEELLWSFMSVLHWGEDPRGEWALHLSFKSKEGYVQMRHLNVSMYGVESAVESVSTDCSPECKGGCAAFGVPYCDACKVYRDAETLKCTDNCTEEFELHNQYCIRTPIIESDGYVDKYSSVSTQISGATYIIKPTPTCATPTSNSELHFSPSRINITGCATLSPTITDLPTTPVIHIYTASSSSSMYSMNLSTHLQQHNLSPSYYSSFSLIFPYRTHFRSSPTPYAHTFEVQEANKNNKTNTPLPRAETQSEKTISFTSLPTYVALPLASHGSSSTQVSLHTVLSLITMSMSILPIQYIYLYML